MTVLAALRSPTRRGIRRTRSVRSTSSLAALLASHYSRGQPPSQASEYAEQAQQELRWLEDAARARSFQDGSRWEDRLEDMVKEMVEQDKPLAYVLGSQPFHPLPVELLVRTPTLIPRPETEFWVSLLSQRFLRSPCSSPTLNASSRRQRPFRLLDVGTGTGCIAIGLTYALAKAAKGQRVIQALALDRSASALELATENAERCGLFQNLADPSSPRSATEAHVSFLQADLFSTSFSSTVLEKLSTLSVSSSIPSPPPSQLSSEHRFDLVVSNPPYITRREYTQLERSVRDWEDRGALVGEVASEGQQDETGDGDGLVFYRRIVSLLPNLLSLPSLAGKEGREGKARSPAVALEVGQDQARAVEQMLVEQGFETEVVEDPWGVERAVFGYAKKR